MSKREAPADPIEVRLMRSAYYEHLNKNSEFLKELRLLFMRISSHKKLHSWRKIIPRPIADFIRRWSLSRCSTSGQGAFERACEIVFKACERDGFLRGVKVVLSERHKAKLSAERLELFSREIEKIELEPIGYEWESLIPSDVTYNPFTDSPEKKIKEIKAAHRRTEEIINETSSKAHLSDPEKRSRMALRLYRRVVLKPPMTWKQIAVLEKEETHDPIGISLGAIERTVTHWAKVLDIPLPKIPRGHPRKPRA